MIETPELLTCARHAGEQTRLRCSSCATPICPRCMVSTEVGFKCPACVHNIRTHLSEVRPWHYGALLGLSALAGFAYGWVHPVLMGLGFFSILGVSLLGLFLAFVLGHAAGRGIQGLIRYKRAPWMSLVLLVGLLAGLTLSPMVAWALGVLEFARQASQAAQSPLAPTSSLSLYVISQGLKLLGVAAFYHGLRWPFMGRS